MPSPSSTKDSYVKEVSKDFFQWIHNICEVEELSTGIDRDRVGELFQNFLRTNSTSTHTGIRQPKRFEGMVMAELRYIKLMKSNRYEGVGVVCNFALPNNEQRFVTIEERKTARNIMRRELLELHTNKHGISISDEPILNDHSHKDTKHCVMPMNEDVKLVFEIKLDIDTANDGVDEDDCDDSKFLPHQHHILGVWGHLTEARLTKIKVTGSNKKSFRLITRPPFLIERNQLGRVQLVFRATRIALYRAVLTFEFEHNCMGEKMRFSITRSLLLRSGDADLYNMLKPKTPYTKKNRKQSEGQRISKENIVGAPKQGGRKGSAYKNLEQFFIPVDVRRLVEAKEIEVTLESPYSYSDDVGEEEFNHSYKSFWQNMLWTSELQAYEDIQLFDMENVDLQRQGRLFKLYVAGLAEGRPSVLRGDIVKCLWESKEYRGRVVSVEELDVLIELHESFHQRFNVGVDRVERVRFTFTRTSFRTSHAGIISAPYSMKRSMLMPTKKDVMIATRQPRLCPTPIRWASDNSGGRTLNEEQKDAVREIVKGTLRPLPYIIFGPPGTGKTTTVVEAVYQLAKLHTHKKDKKLKILVVAPSNDATDILVGKLSQYFPPSEMIRVLAYTRSIRQVPTAVRPYCKEGVESNELISMINNVQITVATINMAARLWCTGVGIPKGYFDVLCVDEAGHATEPEVIAVASTLLELHPNGDDKDNHNNVGGQLILAGDPMQLGPVITSELCKKFKMDRSYMERLIKRCPAYKISEDADNSGDHFYLPELVTLLVKNYRSHPDILKLPNEIFYRNQLFPCGDKFVTHSMTKWEHLPNKGFPIMFHSVNGENTREGNSPSWFNPEEVMVVVQYAIELIQNSKPKINQEDIGIITPYARQVQKIRAALYVSGIDGIKVGSVETFQGQERRVIIISTVRSENELLSSDRKYNLGFVSNEKRFNVAVTRAKALLIVVGNPKVLATDDKNWLQLLRFCRDNGSWLGEEWVEGASSDDEEEDDGNAVDDDNEDDDDCGWQAVVHEAHGFINREE